MTNDSQVQFQVDKWEKPELHSGESSKMAQWVIKHSGGLVETESRANYVLMGFVLVSIAAALYFSMLSTPTEPTSGAVPPGQVLP